MTKRKPKCPQRVAFETIKPLLPLIRYVIAAHFRWALPRLKTGLYEIDDLNQEGALGILRAIELYNPKKGKLEDYVCWHIRGRIGRFLRYNSLPNITMDIHKSAGQSFLPIDQPMGNDTATTLADIISVKSYQLLAPQRERQASMRKLALLALKQIPPPDRQLILKHFGICNCRTKHVHHHDPMTLDQIGKKIGVSRQRVDQKLREVLIRLRNNRELEKIKQEWGHL